MIYKSGNDCYERVKGWQNAYKVYPTSTECNTDPLGYFNSAHPTCHEVDRDVKVPCISPSPNNTVPVSVTVTSGPEKEKDSTLIIIGIVFLFFLISALD